MKAEPAYRSSDHFVRAVLLTALLAGTLDMLGASIHFYAATGGKSPAIVWKFVASAVLGKSAFAGGTGIVLLGLLFHYCVATSFTFLFFWLYPRISLLGKSPWFSGFLYAFFVWAVMNLLVIPLTRLSPQPMHVWPTLIGIGILVIAIGLPISLLTHRYYESRASE